MAGQRGGRRAGTPGQAYSNRTDLNENRTLPVQTAESTGYGDRIALERQQQAVPLRAPDQPAGGQRQPAPAPMAPPPGLNDPTLRPDEPLTAGIGQPSGPSPDMERLRTYLPALTAVASTPGATAEYRNYVRRLRAAVK